MPNKYSQFPLKSIGAWEGGVLDTFEQNYSGVSGVFVKQAFWKT